MTGTIFLYDETDTLVRVREYRNPNERKDIIKSWQLSIGERFLAMAIHITPNAREDYINLDGTNSTKQPLHQMPEPLKPKILRPPSVYDNDGRSLYPK